MTLARNFLVWSCVAVLVAFVLYGVGASALRAGTTIRTEATLSDLTQQTEKHAVALAFLTTRKDSAADAGYVTGLEDLPPSLRGTQPDGALRVDANNQLIIDHHVRLLFDYFLTATGEEPLPQILARARAYIRFHLPEPAVAQANALLDDYMALLNRMAELERPEVVPSGNLQSVEEHLRLIADIRKEYLSTEAANAFFGEEESYDHFTLEKIGIMADDQLTAEQKAQQIADLQAQLPATLREDLAASRKIVDMEQSRLRLLDEGGAADDVHQLRREWMGEAAAERLAALDVVRAEWSVKVEDWLAVRKSVLQDDQLSQPDKAQLLAQLRSARFSGSEIRRVQALETIDDQHL